MSTSTLAQIGKSAAETEPSQSESPKLVAVLPAGGRGLHMFPVTNCMPKALLPIDSKPMLVHVLHNLDPRVFEKAFILSSHWHKMIDEYLKAFRGQIRVDFECLQVSPEEKPPASLVRMLDQDQLSDPFLLHYCDILLRQTRWRRVYDHYRRERQDEDIIGSLLISASFQYPVGVVSIDEGRLLTEFRQMPARILDGYANCGVSLFATEFVAQYVQRQDVEIFDESLKRALAARRKIAGYEIRDWGHIQQLRDWFDEQKNHYPHVVL